MPQLQPISRRITRAVVMLSIVGGMIGLLHSQDLVVAMLLAAATPLAYRRLTGNMAEPASRLLILAGMLLSGFFGIQVELWGIQGGHWEYHELTAGRSFPYWLPFAWALAFAFLYRLEQDFIRILKLDGLAQKFALAAALSAVFPTWGEVITINLGVWTYAWEHQLLGVPLLAIALLMIFHVGIFAVLSLACRLTRTPDPVFGSPEIRSVAGEPAT